MSDELKAHYVGEIIDPEQSPITLSVYSCEYCGALLTESSLPLHARWHVNEIFR